MCVRMVVAYYDSHYYSADAAATASDSDVAAVARNGYKTGMK